MRLVHCAILLFLFLAPESKGDEPRLELRDWIYIAESNNQSFPVKTGIPLSQQIPFGASCCNGMLRTKTHIPQGYFREGLSPVLFIPAFGGEFKVRINGEFIGVPQGDHSAVGPILPLSSNQLSRSEIEIEIYTQGKPSHFSGFSEEAPIIGTLQTLQIVRDSAWFSDRALPMRSEERRVGKECRL